jgi:hypothetical protein
VGFPIDEFVERPSGVNGDPAWIHEGLATVADPCLLDLVLDYTVISGRFVGVTGTAIDVEPDAGRGTTVLLADIRAIRIRDPAGQPAGG